jgi:hypothetical protein
VRRSQRSRPALAKAQAALINSEKSLVPAIRTGPAESAFHSSYEGIQETMDATKEKDSEATAPPYSPVSVGPVSIRSSPYKISGTPAARRVIDPGFGGPLDTRAFWSQGYTGPAP